MRKEAIKCVYCVVNSYEAMNMKTAPLKITTIGDEMIGKTCLLVTYTKNEFPKDYVQTIYDNHTCNLGIDGKEYEVTLWDTAGLTQIFYLIHFNFQ